MCVMTPLASRYASYSSRDVGSFLAGKRLSSNSRTFACSSGARYFISSNIFSSVDIRFTSSTFYTTPSDCNDDGFSLCCAACSSRDGAAAEIGLRVNCGCVVRWALSFVSAVGAQAARFHVVAQVSLQDFYTQILFERGRADRRDDFDAAVEIAVHPVGAADIDFRRAVVRKVIDATMFEEAPDDAQDVDAFGESGNAGAQSADAAHDEIDADARLRCFVKRADDADVGQAVDLGNDACAPAGARVISFAFRHLHSPP